MLSRTIITYLIFPLVVLGLSDATLAEQKTVDQVIENSSKKSDRNYFSFGVALNEFRSVKLVLEDVNGNIADIEFPLTAQTYALSASLGTYITDHFKTELRYGTGIREDSLKGAMDVNINYALSWYIGATHPVTDYMSAYAFYGVSIYDADVTRREVERPIPDQFGFPTIKPVRPSITEMEEDLFGTKFSTSWLLGLDFGITDDLFLAFEYGRLLRDTDSNIKVYQAGTYLRYEY